MQKVLLIHGWYHSKKRYQKLAQDLKSYACDSIDLPGFGEFSYCGELEKIEEEQVAYVSQVLESGYDFVIAHSWGCRILLQAIKDPGVTCILLNPAYGDNLNLKFLKNQGEILAHLLGLPQKLPSSLRGFPIKLASLPSVNHLQQMDDILLEDVEKANPQVARKILEIMTNQPFYSEKTQVPNEIFLLYSAQDRAIHPSCFQQFIQDFNPHFHVFPQVGHTLVLEAYQPLLYKIQEILCISSQHCIEFIEGSEICARKSNQETEKHD